MRLKRVRVRSACPRSVLPLMVTLALSLPPHAAAQGPAGGLTLQGTAAGRQAPTGLEGALALPSVSAVRAAQPPRLDGRLDDGIWQTAAHVTRFVQQTPVEGQPASEQTDFYIAYDNQQLYFGIYAHYSDISQMRANRVDRDATGEDDTITVSLDPFLDQQTGYSFSVNGYGVQADSILNRGASSAQGDSSWNVLFTSAGQLMEDGWTAEMAIPFKSLRYPARGNNEAHRWGLQIEREIKTKYETVHWSPISRDVQGFMRQMGMLDGMTNLSTSRNFEVLPTFTAVSQGSMNRTTGEYSTTSVQEGGVNVKYGLTSNLTMDFTYNPDFSQIESDAAQIEVNQRFAIQYPELRPFFLEGAPIFNIGGPAQMVHTRTIVDPQYGAKLTGRIGKTTIGFLLADDEAPGKVEDPRDPAFNQTAKALIARARYEYAPESSIGVLFTDREFLTGYSRLAGIDTRFRIGQTQRVGMFFMVTDHLDVNGTRRKGHIFEFNTTKETRNFGYFLAHHPLSPDLRSDLGFIRRTNWIGTSGRVWYRWWPEHWITNWSPEFNYDRTYDYDGVLQNAGPGAKVDFKFAKNMNLNVGVSHDLERYREVDFVKNRFTVSGGINASRRISFTGSIDQGEEIRFTSNPYLGSSTAYSLSTTVRPNARLQSTLKLTTSRFIDVRTDAPAFDVKILRSQTTYQFTPRLLVRNIMEFNSGLGSQHTMFENFLVTYRVNAGTAFYVGYDDRYRQGNAINPSIFDDTAFQRTNRAIFTKIQYLFRSGGDTGN